MAVFTILLWDHSFVNIVIRRCQHQLQGQEGEATARQPGEFCSRILRIYSLFLVRVVDSGHRLKNWKMSGFALQVPL